MSLVVSSLVGKKVELPVFFTFIEEASNNFLEKVHPLHKGGRKAADEGCAGANFRARNSVGCRS